jgi:cytochrome c oxidase assembly protein subunit 15
MIFAMVIIGGITRLTESGLSITEWRPISGVLPPLSSGRLAAGVRIATQQIPKFQRSGSRHDAGGIQGHLLVGDTPTDCGDG